MKPPRFGKWTSAAAQLPGRNETVIALYSTGIVGVANGVGVASDNDIMFWMPLPLPPPPDAPLWAGRHDPDEIQHGRFC